ncbi:hypothetical protein GCM10009858_45460 [Terrabacter carboxydivorans]|uniref:Uncharacterized protein n=1 Tax=Terrabacter carboxydivorans TaxID=619730 RepID=A0ABN3MI13_9MICO
MPWPVPSPRGPPIQFGTADSGLCRFRESVAVVIEREVARDRVHDRCSGRDRLAWRSRSHTLVGAPEREGAPPGRPRQYWLSKTQSFEHGKTLADVIPGR